LRHASGLRALGRPEAEAAFAEALRVADDPPDGAHVGHLYKAWGCREEAVAAYRRCLERPSLRGWHHSNAEQGLRRLARGADAASGRTA
jgi:hypothetical protein